MGEVLLVPDLTAAVSASWLDNTCLAPVDMMEKDLGEHATDGFDLIW